MGAFDFLDYIPGVGDVKRGIEAGDPKYNLDTTPFEEDRRRALEAQKQLDFERQYAHTPVSNVAARTVTGQTVAAPTIDTGAVDAVRAREMANIDALQRRAAGQAPSVAGLTYAAAIPGITSQIQGQAGQMKGQAGTIARLEANDTIAKIRQKAALDMALGRAAEMTGASGQVTSALGGVRTADQNLAVERARQALTAGTETAHLQQGADTTTAQLGTEADKSNQSAGIQGQQVTNQYKLGLGNQQLEYSAQAANAAKVRADQIAAERERRLKRSDNVLQAGAKAAFGAG